MGPIIKMILELKPNLHLFSTTEANIKYRIDCLWTSTLQVGEKHITFPGKLSSTYPKENVSKML